VKSYKVSITRGGACARLHEAMGWWRARRLDFTRYKHVDGDPPPRTRGATTTEHVEGGKGATASVPPVAAAAAAKATARELAFKEKARRPQVAKRSRKDTTGTEWAYRLLVRMSGVAQRGSMECLQIRRMHGKARSRKNGQGSKVAARGSLFSRRKTRRPQVARRSRKDLGRN